MTENIRKAILQHQQSEKHSLENTTSNIANQQINITSNLTPSASSKSLSSLAGNAVDNGKLIKSDPLLRY